MPMLRSRRGALALALFALVASLAIIGGVQADSPDVGVLQVSDQMEIVPVPPAVLEIRDQYVRQSRPSGADLDAVPAQSPETIAFETFEEDVWPPENWEVMGIDDAGQQDDSYTWGRVTCEAYESDAAAWSLGGGTEGSNLPCWTPYSNYVDTYLMYPGIDTTNYQGGIQIQLRLKRHIPRDDAFRICVMRAGEQQASCFSTRIGDDPGVETPWLQLSNPWVFENTGGLTDLMFFFWFTDRDPDGNFKGVLVDDVLIEGLPEQAPPTNTPTPGPGEPTQPPPTPEGPRVFLPLLMKAAQLSDLEPIKTPEPSRVNGAFGIGLDSQTGELLGEGTAFEYGQMLMCFRMSWEDVPVGTAMRYQWYVNDQAILPDDTGLNPRWTNETATGWAGNCIQATNPETGERIPIPLGSYRVDMFVEDITPEAPVAASAEAVVQEETPEGATPLPSPTPTIDSEKYDCNDILINGDFEQGPNVGWSLNSNAVDENENPITTDAVIIQNEAAYQGDWFAFLGRGLNIVMQLYQSDEVPLYDEAKLYSATLTYWTGILTEEVPDGEHNDQFASFFLNQAWDPEDPIQNIEQVPNSGISEETVPAGRWIEFSFDVTDMMKKREGWDTMRLMFMSLQNDSAITRNFLDETSLVVCTIKEGGGAAAARRPSGQTSVELQWPLGDQLTDFDLTSADVDASFGAGELEFQMAPAFDVR